ncbi:hypothetical protein [Phyllobacterium sp. SB3]|uniref:hypothetical protein n=1 Tax=Phyllobacterium sp. SB3 TaxID=3156073 RepID=UPI0032AF98CB
MAIKFAQKTSDTKTPAPADKAPIRIQSEKIEAATIQADETEGGTDLFETKSGTQKRKKKR